MLVVFIVFFNHHLIFENGSVISLTNDARKRWGEHCNGFSIVTVQKEPGKNKTLKLIIMINNNSKKTVGTRIKLNVLEYPKFITPTHT